MDTEALPHFPIPYLCPSWPGGSLGPCADNAGRNGKVQKGSMSTGRGFSRRSWSKRHRAAEGFEESRKEWERVLPRAHQIPGIWLNHRWRRKTHTQNWEGKKGDFNISCFKECWEKGIKLKISYPHRNWKLFFLRLKNKYRIKNMVGCLEIIGENEHSSCNLIQTKFSPFNKSHIRKDSTNENKLGQLMTDQTNIL